ncbi:hypothetical protein AB0F72_08550 [Actinoplanes sp. NPDC023936]|uniref:hypothetical protein n=1 Tax=Actinoplanes sp. NPDC023936 TaxID=3154910 RepID=UPI0033E9D2CB
MTTITAEQAATQIEQAYRTEITQRGQQGWVTVVALMNRLDLTVDQMTAGARLLARKGGWAVAPTSNQKALSDLDRASALWIGGQWKHVISAN